MLKLKTVWNSSGLMMKLGLGFLFCLHDTERCGTRIAEWPIFLVWKAHILGIFFKNCLKSPILCAFYLIAKKTLAPHAFESRTNVRHGTHDWPLCFPSSENIKTKTDHDTSSADHDRQSYHLKICKYYENYLKNAKSSQRSG